MEIEHFSTDLLISSQLILELQFSTQSNWQWRIKVVMTVHLSLRHAKKNDDEFKGMNEWFNLNER